MKVLLQDRFVHRMAMLLGMRTIVPPPMPPSESRVMVLGWYDRGNLGDECYREAFRLLFGDVRFACTDEVDAIPSDVEVLVCGGGDIVNPFFVSKIRRLLKTFSGPCYAVSVGVPFSADASLLSVFDHVFVRSASDYDVAVSAVPSSNVSRIPDLSWLLRQTYAPCLGKSVSRRRLGVCLAQPAFYGARDGVRDAVVRTVDRLRAEYDVYLLAFNTHEQNASECDYVINDAIVRACGDGGVTDVRGVRDRDGMMAYIASMDVMLCMRYHAIQYCLQARKPFAAVYTTKKVQSLLTDAGCLDCGYRLPTDGSCRPTAMDVDRVCGLVAQAQVPSSYAPSVDVAAICDAVHKRVRGTCRFVPSSCDDLETTLRRAQAYLTRLLGSEHEDAVAAWLSSQPRAAQGAQWDSEAVARTLCFAITKRVSSPYVWGMVENARSPAFDARAAIEWVWSDCAAAHPAAVDLPPPSGPIDVTIDMSYFTQDDFQAYHRSGWSACLTALMRLDASVTQRDPCIRVDGYVDRTFLWGASPLLAAGVIPYVQPWIGFVHHTFNDTFGINNCCALFESAPFLESLASCRALIVLSEYLAAQMREALDRVGAGHVRVRVLYHPMEMVPDVFTLAKFDANEDRKVVNIGAWLRNPYAIYEMPLDETWRNPYHVHKAILRGKDMGSSSEPDWLMPFLEDRLRYCATLQHSAPLPGDGMCRSVPGDGMCRSVPGSDVPENHHLVGMVDMLRRQHDSVRVLEKLDNDAYDALLSENIVFLNLVDASACNTVMECLMRHTPLLVNRHPAVEEILGANYPGYYDNVRHAAEMLADRNAIASMHAHLVGVDKTPFTMDTFVSNFQTVVREACGML
jgi:hypothetical protein